ncbi:DUF4258 domain-containing protein [Rhizobium sp. RAF56]|jgi:uncharacterized DUF497 family protein|uniref:DUF4258 domain-containing protein n=1 Tax=Rhizobium sp. RAF56 TaxID=3233062 RepID=UPI003F9D354C
MTKPLLYTYHAETVISERGLDKRWVEAVVRRPDWRAPDPSGSDMERRFGRITERDGRYLRVVCVENTDYIRIISAFLDRGARRPE